MKKTKTVTVTRKDYEQSLKEGADPEFAMKPGKHLFRRGGFHRRHPGFDAQRAEKIMISIKLDRDIVDFFKSRAAVPNAAPYQTQINAALHAFMEGQGGDDAGPETQKLLHNESFLTALADRLRNRV